MSSSTIPTAWVLGDQQSRTRGALGRYGAGECRVLLVESRNRATSKRWHRQRLHLVLSAMAHFAAEVRAEGFEVDHRHASTLAAGFAAHVEEYGVERVVATEPMSWDGRMLLERLDVVLVRDDHFLCHYEEFAAWVDGRKQLKMEDFYRAQRMRLDILIDVGSDGPEPVGGRWNHDHDNPERPPKDGRSWPEITRFDLDDIDREIIERLPETTFGAEPDGT